MKALMRERSSYTEDGCSAGCNFLPAFAARKKEQSSAVCCTDRCSFPDSAAWCTAVAAEAGYTAAAGVPAAEGQSTAVADDCSAAPAAGVNTAAAGCCTAAADGCIAAVAVPVAFAVAADGCMAVAEVLYFRG